MNTFIYFTNEMEKKWALDYFEKKGRDISHVQSVIRVIECFYGLTDGRYISCCSLEAATNYLSDHPGNLIYASKYMNIKLDFILSLINK